jgi:hypothetical protein
METETSREVELGMLHNRAIRHAEMRKFEKNEIAFLRSRSTYMYIVNSQDKHGGLQRSQLYISLRSQFHISLR